MTKTYKIIQTIQKQFLKYASLSMTRQVWSLFATLYFLEHLRHAGERNYMEADVQDCKELSCELYLKHL